MSTTTPQATAGIGILGLGHCLPQRVLTNFDLEKMVDTSNEWILTRTGIRERRIASKDERNSMLAIGAAREALQQANVSADKIDLIVVATISPDSNFPAVACLVQKAIGAKKAAAFDVSAACSSFLFALTTAKQYLATGMFKRALVVASEKITSLIDWSDRNTCVLFGDGAGACVLGPCHLGYGIISEHMASLGEHAELMTVVAEDREALGAGERMMRMPYVVMQGQELFKIAVKSMAEAVKIVVRKAGITLEDVECVVPHQANDRIMSGVAKHLGIPKDKFFINIDRYGNMSAASVAVALYEAVREKRVQKGGYVVLVVFGAGLTVAANVVRW